MAEIFRLDLKRAKQTICYLQKIDFKYKDVNKLKDDIKICKQV